MLNKLDCEDRSNGQFPVLLLALFANVGTITNDGFHVKFSVAKAHQGLDNATGQRSSSRSSNEAPKMAFRLACMKEC